MNRKQVNRGMNDFYCTDCLAAFEVTPQDIREKSGISKKMAVCCLCNVYKAVSDAYPKGIIFEIYCGY